MELNDLYTKTFGKNLFPTNIKLVDIISDKSDQRSIWRHTTAFINSEIIETIFNNVFTIETRLQNFL